MTSIRYYKDPAIVKLDGRFKFYPKFKYRIDFDTQGDKWTRWVAVLNWCTNTWGREWTIESLRGTIYNDNYCTACSKQNSYYRHLYLRSEQDLTMLLLVIN